MSISLAYPTARHGQGRRIPATREGVVKPRAWIRLRLSSCRSRVHSIHRDAPRGAMPRNEDQLGPR